MEKTKNENIKNNEMIKKYKEKEQKQKFLVFRSQAINKNGK